MPIHPTALVDPRAEVDATAEIGPYCVVEANVRIEAGCVLYPYVFVTGWTQIGAYCKVHPGAVIGHEPQDIKFPGEKSYCRIGPRTIIRELATIHRGTEPGSETTIGEGCFLLAGAHVAHNCRLGDGVTLINNVLLGGHVQVGNRATLGGGAAIHQFCRIGELAMITGNARISRDALPFSMVGPDGRIVGLNRIGMRRSQLTIEERNEVRDLYRAYFRRSTTEANQTDKMGKFTPTTAAGKRLMEFIYSKSLRGLAGRSSKNRAVSSSDAD